MKIIILISFLTLANLFGSSQSIDRKIHSNRTVTTLSEGVAVNIEKVKDNYFWILYNGNGNKWVSIHDAPIMSGKSTSNVNYNLYSVKTAGSCTNYWTKQDDSGKIFLFKICEEGATPYIQMSTYNASDAVTKIVYYYFD